MADLDCIREKLDLTDDADLERFLWGIYLTEQHIDRMKNDPNYAPRQALEKMNEELAQKRVDELVKLFNEAFTNG